MKATVYEQFQQPIEVRDVSESAVPADGVVLSVGATGLCRSDWHGWMGHDADIRLPHVPGHEIAGTVEAVGRDVRRFGRGDRVTLPFVCGCGRCSHCVTGNQQVCDQQTQPGFTHWGSFAEFVAVHNADDNLVRLPDELEILGSHGMQAHRYPDMLDLIASGRVDLSVLAGRSVSLAEGAAIIGSRELRMPPGISVINRFH